MNLASPFKAGTIDSKTPGPVGQRRVEPVFANDVNKKLDRIYMINRISEERPILVVT